MMVFGRPIPFMACLLGLILAPAAHAATQLQDGQASDPFDLGPGESRAFYIDVPDDASHMKFLLEGARALQDDVDLFVRYDEPFDESSNPFPQALYYAIGETALEHLEITFASSPPVSPGRWHMLVFNPTSNNPASDVELMAALQRDDEPSLTSVEMDIAYSDGPNEGFNDKSTFTGEGGNQASTLGEARRAAFEAAVTMLEESFTSPVAITVDAYFDPSMDSGDDDDERGPLASASVSGLANFPGARAGDTWYANSIVPRLAGTDICRLTSQDCRQDPEADVTIRFNPNPPNGWWYGLQRSPSGLADGYDFVAVAAHEMLHGLGFLSFANVETGALASAGDGGPTFTDAYTSQIVRETNNGNFRPVDQMTDAQRKQAFTSQTDLYWGGDNGEDFWDERRFGSGGCGTCPKPPLYAPSEPNQGSSVSHTNFTDIMYWSGGAPTSNQNINIREGGPELGAAWYLLRDAGWDEDPKEKLGDPPRAEVPRGVWYDRARDGHGFDFQRVGDNWFLLFYTYDDTGNPEWYLSVGSFEDGVFSGELQRFTYDASDPDDDGSPQSGEPVGSVTLDLDAGTPPAACEDGVNRDSAVALAEFAWQIGEQSGTWCAEPLLFGQQAADPDFTGNWYAGAADDGWGMTIQVREQGNGNQILLNTLYFYDDEGNPRWAQGVTTDFLNDHDAQAIDMQQFDGYARDSDCTPNTCTLGDEAGTSAGPLRLRLQEPLLGPEAGSRATLGVDYLGPEGGEWVRDEVPIQMISDPR